jgi:hypothetical protein
MEEARERFFNKVNKTETCWLWTAGCQHSGHGQFTYNGKHVMAHRFSWLLAGHTIPEGLCVCHAPHSICGHKNCVNPQHLRVDTKAANMRDTIADGTSARGTRNHTNKLTEEQVREIRRRCTENQRIIAEEFGVSKYTISSIITKRSWAWLD